MSEHEIKEEAAQNEQGSAAPSYTYRWNYGDQCAYENAHTRKKKKSGVAVYAIVMTAVFLVCFGILAGVLIWYHEPSEQNAMTTGEISEAVSPSTVLIYASNTTGYGYGTGFFIRSNGYIATNYHVVEGKTNITVTLYAGNTLEAELVGYSANDDLAVLKVAGSNYPAVSIGDSDALRVGDVAIAIGNPSGTNAAWTTTQGIISALNREVTVTQSGTIEELTMIQTDAPVNPGNSGGPLCNDHGEVIGVVTRKLTDYEGIGLAIPINGAMEILNAIVETGTADGVQSSISKVRPAIGISVKDVKKGESYQYDYKGSYFTAGHDGVWVVSVDSAGAAYGKLQMHDIIIAMDGETVTTQVDLTELLYRHSVGDEVTFTVWRNGEAVDVKVTLGKSTSAK